MLQLAPPDGSDRILLHSCCAPCSGALLECMVNQGFSPVVFFSNSNIDTREEYEHRRTELERYCRQLGLEFVDDEYDHESWLSAVRGLENEPERGNRCRACFEFRLRRAARYAKEHGLDVLTTSLASSRWKNLDQVNEAGESAVRSVNDGKVKFWPMNWRKGGLQPRRAEVIREQNFYNQTYCGCEFSHRAG